MVMAALNLTGCIHGCSAAGDGNSNSFVHFTLEIPLYRGFFLLTDKAMVYASAIAVVVHKGVHTRKRV